MKIAVLGLWHLGCVTAACCARLNMPEITAWLAMTVAAVVRITNGTAGTRLARTTPVIEPARCQL